jgi:hypothetical protein
MITAGLNQTMMTYTSSTPNRNVRAKLEGNNEPLTHGEPQFKELDGDEIILFKDWARRNYVKGDPINPMWHPVIRQECEVINGENS